MTLEQISSYYESSLSGLHDLFLLTDMDKAVERILRAIDSHKKNSIYGDYDVDGTTATALLSLGLRRVGAEVDFCIPPRMIDGYGISLNSLDQLKEAPV